jgi:hypothetical protein
VSVERAPLALFEAIRDEYAAITDDDDLSRYDEVQARLREALAAVGWVPPEACWLPLRCPRRGYCTQFLEGGCVEPCGWWPEKAQAVAHDVRDG